MLEGQPLTLVDGDGPGQAEGELFESALYFGLDDFRFGIDDIFIVLPGFGFDIDRLIISLALYLDQVFTQTDDPSDAAVIEALFL